MPKRSRKKNPAAVALGKLGGSKGGPSLKNKHSNILENIGMLW